MRADIAAQAVDAAFEELGEPGDYLPPSAGVPVFGALLMLSQPDAESGIGEMRARVASARIDVRSSEVANPLKDGRFIIGGINYKIISAPQRTDAARLIWSCEVAEAPPS